MADDLSKVRGPFRVYEKPKKKEPVSTVDEYQDAFLKGLESYELSQRKPVRWNFLKDNEGMFQLSQTLDPYAKANEGLNILWNKATGREDELAATQLRKGFQKKINEPCGRVKLPAPRWSPGTVDTSQTGCSYD
jgi:hypothetical protein